MDIGRLLERLRPVHAADRGHYERVIAESSIWSGELAWYASSSLDLYPLAALLAGRVPPILARELHETTLLMSDYWSGAVGTLKRVYAELDHGPVRVVIPGHGDGFGAFRIHADNHNELEGVEATVHEMIPLSLWTEEERAALKERFSKHYHRSPTHLLIPDPEWHVVLLLVHVAYRGESGFFPIVFVAAENLLVFQEVIMSHELPLKAFFAVRVAGYSGSWDSTHGFGSGKLPTALLAAPAPCRPRLWGLELDKWGNALPPSFRRVAHVPGLGFGGCTFFATGS